MLIDETYTRQTPSTAAIMFSFAFARMEYALKAAGYYKRGRNREIAADWDRVATATEDLENDAQPKVAEAIDYFYQYPPMVERERSGHVEFVAVPPGGRSNTALFTMIRRVRNNLFHGGKMPYGDRDERLVHYSLQVLGALLERNHEIAKYFG